jgi:hypothetical protein
LPQLKELVERVEAVFLIEGRKERACREVAEYSKKQGIVTYEVLVRGRTDVQAARDLGRVFERVGPRIVHAHDFKASAYTLAAVRTMKAEIPLLVSTHHGVRGRPGLRAKLYESIYTRMILPKFDRTLAVCASDRTSLVRRGVPADRVAGGILIGE